MTVKEGLKSLEVLRENDLSLNPTKCNFEVCYLDFSVGMDGIKATVKTIAARNFEPPKSARQARQFLEVSGFFR